MTPPPPSPPTALSACVRSARRDAPLIFTSYVRLGRLKVLASVAASRSCSWREMSALTVGVAVAVSASTGTPGSAARAPASRRKSGRKSLPHSLTQCASSTASRCTRPLACMARSVGSQPCTVSGVV